VGAIGANVVLGLRIDQFKQYVSENTAYGLISMSGDAYKVQFDDDQDDETEDNMMEEEWDDDDILDSKTVRVASEPFM
jgi:hypothetical protein